LRRFSRSIQVTLPSPSLFNNGAFGQTSLTFSGNGKTDSYNSSLGRYNVNGNKGFNGHVATNGATAGAISLSGNALIQGNAATGPGGTTTLAGNARVTGTISDDSEVELPAVSVPTALTSLPSLGAFSLAGNSTQTWNGGSYQYTTLSLSGNAKLTLNGDVKLYLTTTGAGNTFSQSGNSQLIVNGSVTVYCEGGAQISGNGLVNRSFVPASFLFYGTENAGTVSISGNGALYGVVYAPSSPMAISGNGDIYGALVAASVSDTGNGTIHYDEGTRSIADYSHVQIDSWEEVY
jgi:hypothetical protein